MIQFRENSWHAKLYKLTNGSELPSDFCSYFWNNIISIFLTIMVTIAIPIVFYAVIYLFAFAYFILILDILYFFIMILGIFILILFFGLIISSIIYIMEWCDNNIKFKERIWWNNIKIIIKSVKDKVCPLIKWEGKSNEIC